MPLPLEQVVHNDNLYGFNLTRMSDTVPTPLPLSLPLPSADCTLT